MRIKMANADFYYGTQNNLVWIGSIQHGGHVDEVPAEILVQQNKMFFEELVVCYIKSCGGVVSSENGSWPHLYANSELTDYVYIFETNYEQVLLFLSETDFLVNPLQLLQGCGLTESVVVFEKPRFPFVDLFPYQAYKNEVNNGCKNTKHV